MTDLLPDISRFSQTELAGLEPYQDLPPMGMPVYLDELRVPAIGSLMIREARTDHFFGWDSSLLAQLGNLITPEGIPTEVEAIAFTMNSAAPVADAVRGIFDFIGIEPPAFLAVKCNPEHRRLYRQEPNLLRDEMRRLKRELDGREKVVLIDEHVRTGETLLVAEGMLLEAGATNVDWIGGEWYRNTFKGEVKPLGSVYQFQMHAIGVESAKIFLEHAVSAEAVTEEAAA